MNPINLRKLSFCGLIFLISQTLAAGICPDSLYSGDVPFPLSFSGLIHRSGQDSEKASGLTIDFAKPKYAGKDEDNEGDLTVPRTNLTSFGCHVPFSTHGTVELEKSVYTISRIHFFPRLRHLIFYAINVDDPTEILKFTLKYLGKRGNHVYYLAIIQVFDTTAPRNHFLSNSHRYVLPPGKTAIIAAKILD